MPSLKLHLAVASCLLATTAAAEPHLLPTPHVPTIVANHTAAPVGLPDPQRSLELTISLPLRHEAELDALLHSLYDPASPSYRHYLTSTEFTARFGPSAGDYAAVQHFAEAAGLTLRAPLANNLAVDVSGTVAKIERAFHITLGLYRDPSDGRSFIAPDREPAIELATPILHISGLDDAVLPAPHLIRGQTIAHTATGSGPGGSFIGSDVRAAYYGGSALTGAGQSLALLEFGGYTLADVQTYFTKIGQPLAVPIQGVALNGASLDCSLPCDDSEQVLDMEEAISMAPGLDRVIAYVGMNAVSILARMAADDSSAQLSSSWGWNPDRAVDEPIFKEFAAQGQSFVDATGDEGFLLKRGAVWPGDDAYVTGIGGTDLATRGAGGPWAGETGWTFSGGGPSPDGIKLPAAQKPYITAANGASATRRNTPDLAGDANTDNFSCYDAACSTGNGGTSYAAPLWAGFVALANQQAAAEGLPPAGFLNPTLYALGHGSAYQAQFHDQTSGFNGRYHNVPGYDLVTGFGSPAGPATIEALVHGK